MQKIKTRLSLIMVLAFIFTMVIGAAAFGSWTAVQKVDAYSGVKVFFNGKEVINPDQPLIINDRTYVPLRMIMELVGSGVTWDAVNYRVLLTGGASADQLAAKDAEIAALKKKIDELELKKEDSKIDLNKIEDDLLKTFRDAGDDYFNDDYVDVSLSLSGDKKAIDYSIKLKFGKKSSYDDLSDTRTRDIESFLEDVEDDLIKALKNTDYKGASIAGKLVDSSNSKLNVKYNGRTYTYSWSEDDIDDISDDISAAFRNAGSTYFGDSSVRVSISLKGDSKRITYEITVDATRSIDYDKNNKIHTEDLNWLNDSVAQEIKAEIRTTNFKGASITGDYTVKY